MYVSPNKYAQCFVLRGIIIVQYFVRVKSNFTKFCIFVNYVQNGVHIMAEMHEIIDALLNERHISGAQMSADLGMSRSFMTELRKGRAKGIKLETAQKIAEYFNVSLNYLLGEETEKAPAETDKRYPEGYNILKIAGRDGTFRERVLSDQQLAALIAIVDQMPDVPDDL